MDNYRLLELLDIKDAEIEKLSSQVETLENELHCNHTWTRHLHKVTDGDMTVPWLNINFYTDSRGRLTKTLYLNYSQYSDVSYTNIVKVPIYESYSTSQYTVDTSKKDELIQSLRGLSIMATAMYLKKSLNLELVITVNDNKV